MLVRRPRFQGTSSGTTLASTRSTDLDSVVYKCGSVLANDVGLGQSAHANGNWCRDDNVCLLWQSWTRESEVSIPQCEVQQSDVQTPLKRLLTSQVPRGAVVRASVKAGGTSRSNTDKYYCRGQVGHRRPDCHRRNESCSLCGKRGHLSQACRSSGGNASARAVEVEPGGKRNSTRVGTVSL